MNALQIHELGQKEANELRMLILRAPRIFRDRRNPLEEYGDAEFLKRLQSTKMAFHA